VRLKTRHIAGHPIARPNPLSPSGSSLQKARSRIVGGQAN
jgi:hypothetical protein